MPSSSGSAPNALFTTVSPTGPSRTLEEVSRNRVQRIGTSLSNSFVTSRSRLADTFQAIVRGGRLIGQETRGDADAEFGAGHGRILMHKPRGAAGVRPGVARKP